MTCGAALDLQRGIAKNSDDLFEINRLDVNGDFKLDQADLDEWTRSTNSAGDVNVDGRVDSGDLNAIGRNWNETVENGWCDGDLNGDGRVGSADLNLVGANWPEPAADGLNARTPRAPLAHIATQNEDAPFTLAVSSEGLQQVPSMSQRSMSQRSVDVALAELTHHRNDAARTFVQATTQDHAESDAHDLATSLRQNWRQAMMRRGSFPALDA